MRRRLLLSVIANSYKWLDYFYAYLYHDLVPEKIATFNKWDEEWELGYFDLTTGQPITYSTISRSKNFIYVLPSNQYFYKSNGANHTILYYDKNYNYISYQSFGTSDSLFTTPTNCSFIKFAFVGTTYNHDICINISNTQMNGIYAPYHPRTVKGRTRLATIEGNSEVVNQLINKANWSGTTTTNGITFTNNYDGTITVNGTATANADFRLSPNTYTLLANHKYLLFGGKTNAILRFSGDPTGLWIDSGNGIIINPTVDTTAYSFALRVENGNTVNNIKITPQLIGLTQEYPFDTPTSINDPRVQNIIAQGSRPHSTGEIKNTVMTELKARGFNIWDEETRNGYYDTSGNFVSNSSYLANKNPIEVLPNENYYWLCSYRGRYCWYDENMNFISTGTSPSSGIILSPSNAKYLNFDMTSGYGTTYNHDICINRSSSLNGNYKPFNDFTDLAHFSPVQVGTVQDTFKKLDVGYKFEKKTVRYTFTGNEVWVWYNDASFWYISDLLPTTAKSTVGRGNKILSNGLIISVPNDQISIRVYPSDNPQITSSTNMNDVFPSGTTLDYELATPQTITMPLRHMGMVDLGSLSWEYNGTRFISVDLINLVKKPASDSGIANAFTTKYIVNSLTSYTDKQFAISSGGALVVKDATYTDATTFKQAMSGVYLYYETNDVVDETGIVLDHSAIQLPAPLELAGVNTAKNTFEVTDTAYVFTRRVFDVDLGTMVWTYNGSQRYTAPIPNNTKIYPTNETPNWLCETKTPMPANISLSDYQNAICLVPDSGTYKIFTYASSSSAPTPTGKLTYELATPQVISIPRKHLGAVRLKDLTWYRETTYTNKYFYAVLSTIKTFSEGSTPNIFSKYSRYISATYSYLGSNMPNLSITTIRGQRTIAIRDDSYTDATTFKNHFTDNDILFFETEDETTDFINEAEVECGGEVNGVWFSWVENQLVTNGNFESTSGWGFDSASYSLSVANNVATLTALTDLGANDIRNTLIRSTNEVPNGHTTLVFFQIKTTNNVDVRVREPFLSSFQTITPTSSKKLYYMFGSADASLGNTHFQIQTRNITSGTIIEISEINLIDLADGFGAGNEPTDINDTRIQEIIRLGYIPTNTTGTEKNITCPVLPNVDVEFRCK